jgi:phosphatidylglycerol:prolipoprotein diacylglycerol transferase
MKKRIPLDVNILEFIILIFAAIAVLFYFNGCGFGNISARTLPGPFIHNIDPIYAKVGGFYLWFYGTSFTLGFLEIFYWLKKTHKPLEMSLNEVYSLTLFMAMGVLLGGRMVEVIFYEWQYYGAHLARIPAVWLGGMSTHGILLGGVLGIVLFCRVYRRSFLAVADVMAIAGAGIMGIARIGNFIDGQIVGSVTDAWWAVRFPDAEGFRHAVVLYDGLKNIMLIPLLLVIRKHNPPRGVILAHFILWYGLLRIPIDFFREYRTELYGFPPGQEFNLLMTVLGMVMLFRFYRKARRGGDDAIASVSTGPPRIESSRWLNLKRGVFILLLLFPTIIPSDWTQDIPKRYGKRHAGLHYSILYPKIEAADVPNASNAAETD